MNIDLFRGKKRAHICLQTINLEVYSVDDRFHCRADICRQQ